jgi:hypothetical protein
MNIIGGVLHLSKKMMNFLNIFILMLRFTLIPARCFGGAKANPF